MISYEFHVSYSDFQVFHKTRLLSLRMSSKNMSSKLGVPCEEKDELNTRKLVVLSTISLITILANSVVLVAIFRRKGKVRLQMYIIFDLSLFYILKGVEGILSSSRYFDFYPKTAPQRHKI